MAKESGLGWTTASIDDSAGSLKTLVNDITGIRWSITRGVQDVTGMDKSAIERLILLGDFSFTADGVFNDASNQAHDVFKTAASADVARTSTFVISGQTLTNEVWLVDVAMTRAPTGEFTFSVNAVLENGADPTWS